MQLFEKIHRKRLQYVGMGLISFAALFFMLSVFQEKVEAGAPRVILRDGDLFSVSESLGEKRLTRNQQAKILFAVQNGKILFGKGWSGSVEESEQVGGTELWLFDTHTGNAIRMKEGFDVTNALFGVDGQILFTTVNRDLFITQPDGTMQRKLQEKVLFPTVSRNGTHLVYQKLPDTWQAGEYFDAAVGLTLLEIASGKETRVSDRAEDWAAVFSPDGRKILFSSSNEDGISALFSMNADGSQRTQLTNIGQKFVTSETIPSPSEIPIFSDDGSFLIYESDREVWLLQFNPSLTQLLRSKRIAYGVNPQWGNQGKTISVLAVPGSGGSRGLIHVDLNGNIIKQNSQMLRRSRLWR